MLELVLHSIVSYSLQVTSAPRPVCVWCSPLFPIRLLLFWSMLTASAFPLSHQICWYYCAQDYSSAITPLPCSTTAPNGERPESASAVRKSPYLARGIYECALETKRLRVQAIQLGLRRHFVDMCVENSLLLAVIVVTLSVARVQANQTMPTYGRHSGYSLRLTGYYFVYLW